MSCYGLKDRLTATIFKPRLCNEAYDQLKHERDNAVQQVNELRDQSTHIILDFSRKDMEQATEHFKNAREVGDTEYGHTYKGMIHNMKVLIKLSSSQKLFQQEVTWSTCDTLCWLIPLVI